MDTRILSAALRSFVLALLTALSASAAGPSPTDKAKAAALSAEGARELRARRHAEAVILLERATRLDPDAAEAFFRLGDAHHGLALARGVSDKLDAAEARAAVSSYERGVLLDPRLTTLSEPFSFYASLEECRQALGDNENALKANLRSIKVSQSNFMPRLQRASLHFTREEWGLSSVDFYRSVQAARQVKMYGQFARLVRQAPRFAALLKLPQNKIILDTFDALQAGELSEAEAEEQIHDYVDFSVAAKEEEELSAPEAQSYQIAALDREDGEMRDSLNDPASARRGQIPEPPAQTMRRHIETGDEAYAAGRLREAILSYQSALALDPLRHEIPLYEGALLFERMGAAYRRLGLLEESLQALKKALDVPNKRASAYYELSLYCAHTLDFDRSLAFLEKAIRTASSDFERKRMTQDARENEEFASLRKHRASLFAGLLQRAARRS